jgi:hypothetical protein
MTTRAEFKHGTVSPATQPRAVAAYIAQIDELGLLQIAILTEAGGVPRMQVQGLDGRPLRSELWDQVIDAVQSAWADCRVRCACGHTFGKHGHPSPHACQMKDCACAVFKAAEPFFRPDLDELEAAPGLDS